MYTRIYVCIYMYTYAPEVMTTHVCVHAQICMCIHTQEAPGVMVAQIHAQHVQHALYALSRLSKALALTSHVQALHGEYI